MNKNTNKTSPVFQLFISTDENRMYNSNYYKLVHNGKEAYYTNSSLSMARIILNLFAGQPIYEGEKALDRPVAYKKPIVWDTFPDFQTVSGRKAKNDVFGWVYYYQAYNTNLHYEKLVPNILFHVMKQVMFLAIPKYRSYVWHGLTNKIKDLSQEHANNTGIAYNEHWKFPIDYKLWFKAMGQELDY